MQTWVVVLVCLVAGLGAGLGTGFAGLSAAAVISPMLIVCLGVDPYEAVTIALASDVLASATSAIVYGKNKNIDIKNGLIMMIVILIMTFVGSYVAKLIQPQTMGVFSLFMTLFLGIKFIIKPVTTTKEQQAERDKKKLIIKSIISGIFIGFVCGFVGAGGGMMMLMVLTTLLGYELKTAVGTSVFIMAFTALTGSVSHFVLGGISDWLIFSLCIAFTFIFARIGAKIANHVQAKTLNRATGIILTILGVLLIVIKFCFTK